MARRTQAVSNVLAQERPLQGLALELSRATCWANGRRRSGLRRVLDDGGDASGHRSRRRNLPTASGHCSVSPRTLRTLGTLPKGCEPRAWPGRRHTSATARVGCSSLGDAKRPSVRSIHRGPEYAGTVSKSHLTDGVLASHGRPIRAIKPSLQTQLNRRAAGRNHKPRHRVRIPGQPRKRKLR